jgi:hypothetical protein
VELTLVWQEGREGKRLMSATVKQRKKREELGNVTWRSEEGHLALEVKTVNEITCDYVWDKLYPSISVICSKWCVRKAPIVLRAQPLDTSPLSCCQIA